LIGAVIGLGVGKFWGIWLPINKNLWTGSYVLFTAGFALAALAFCYWAVDMRCWRRWAQPFVWYGVNPLGIYFLASWLAAASVQHSIGGVRVKEIVYRQIYAHLFASPYINSMMYGLSYVLLFGIVAWVMHRKRIFIRV
jgi:predicted acyltransferase